MSWFCIYEKRWLGTLYEPPESWCEINDDYDCEHCPHRYSKEDYEADRSDYLYDEYKYFMDI